jgi:hypothetical protein
MVGPPDWGFSLEGCNQLGKGSRREHGGFRTWFWGKISAAERNVYDLVCEEFDLAVTDVSRQTSESNQLQNSAE